MDRPVTLWSSDGGGSCSFGACEDTFTYASHITASRSSGHVQRIALEFN